MKKAVLPVLIAVLVLGFVGLRVMKGMARNNSSMGARAERDLEKLEEGLLGEVTTVEELRDAVMEKDFNPDSMESNMGKEVADILTQMQDSEREYGLAVTRWMDYDIYDLDSNVSRNELNLELDLIDEATRKYVQNYIERTLEMETLANQFTDKHRNRYAKARELIKIYGTTLYDHTDAWRDTITFIIKIESGSYYFSEEEATAIDDRTDRTALLHNQAGEAFQAEVQMLAQKYLDEINSE